ncbi:hypothetical protein GCM10009565_47820 [Amycolatopsis albidoflavus]
MRIPPEEGAGVAVAGAGRARMVRPATTTAATAAQATASGLKVRWGISVSPSHKRSPPAAPECAASVGQRVITAGAGAGPHSNVNQGTAGVNTVD